MIAVIFEVIPHPDRRQRYLDIAAALRPLLEEIDGFISIERFQSLADPAKLLSLSFFRDEAAIAQWRALEAHRAAQAAGRGRDDNGRALFADYRLRIAGVVRDYGMHERAQAPADSRVVNG
ncbi:antibiotic biosynthesis monooxygenase family protein [Pseudoduganella plicata]|uniref:Antibiotic biosynthesis monooxygenase n=1 Tax=Pseudoduganella plicata TaxID=321984 RepID=A0A4P7BL68_9BURK|nr:antibiotic biosynthesis monooxygenase [Pseudoduganella plicata]QBQ38349.1 antibiotic biosynthesis monooxygenase [Pseudoduganella plicata]GGY81428.1 antibiotic biosynthesis monooxygenase [Pseudoduganella plicata]